MSSSLYRRLHSLFTPTTISKTSKPITTTPTPTPTTITTTTINNTAITTPTSTPPISSDKLKRTSESSDTSQTQKFKLIVKKFKKASNSHRFRLRNYFYETTVLRLAAAKQYSLIEDILEHQKKFNDIKNERFTVRLISLYGKSGMFDHAVKLFDEMPELNCQRSNMSFNALLAACVNSKKFDKISEFLRELPEKLGIQPDIVSYNTVLKAFCEMGSMDSAVQVIEKMKKNGLEPDLITYNTLLDAFYRNNRFSDAEELWASMEKEKLVPNVRTYNPKLRALVADNRISEAVDLIQEMKTRGVKPDIYSFNALIKGFCDDGNLEEVKRWYGEIVINDCVPDRLTFGMTVPFVCDRGDFIYALELCKEAVNQQRLVSIKVMQRVVDGLVKELNLEEAKELVELGKSNNYFHYKLKLSSDT